MLNSPHQAYLLKYRPLSINNDIQMLKSDLVDAITARQTNLTRADVDLSVNCLLKNIVESLESGERIEIRGFGSFTVNQINARKNRNPKTGEIIDSPAKTRVHFKPGKELRKRIDDSKAYVEINPK